MKHLVVTLFLWLPVAVTFGQFHAVYIPKDKLSNMKMDGDIKDWDWVKPADFITTRSLSEFNYNAAVDEKNWSCKLIVGWSDITNRVYVMAYVYDNVRNKQPITTKNAHWLNDNFEVLVYPTGNTSAKSFVQYYFLVPYIDKKEEMNVGIGDVWLRSELSWGWQILGSDAQPGYTVYEISMPVWDSWNARGSNFSEKHKLSASEVIRLAFAFNDLDKDKANVMHWNTSPGKGCFSKPMDMSEFILDPPVTRQVSWDNIAEVLKP